MIKITNILSRKKKIFKNKINFNNHTLNEVLNFFNNKDNLLTSANDAVKIQKIIEDLHNK